MKPRRQAYQPSQLQRHRRYGARRSLPVGGLFALAAMIGAVAGAGWGSTSPEQRATFLDTAQDTVVAAGLARNRAPQDGDYWRRCDDARTAGSAPIYRGEPGYREGLDRDNDGIACEPYPY